MDYTYEQLAKKDDAELFDFQLQFPPDHRNFILAGQILDERSQRALLSVETRSLAIAIAALVLAFVTFALSVL
ncbi:MAG TPA: hypothetical protein PLG50_14090 [bacterium]|nr:hypothetical protein [bacterium]HQG46786.1 hypothetical protein [bacterium]HQI47240.1 hypothetical protein [bacterium]HQJ64251.1 hypothetical protein [bacterium]